MAFEIPPSHPRYLSLLQREKIAEGMHAKVVAEAGLFAHGRGESLDYFLGERSQEFAAAACRAAAACLLLAQKPVISVNGNVAALAPEDLVELSKATGAPLEVNLFYRAPGREEAIEAVLKKAGAEEVLGVGEDASAVIDELTHGRRIVSPRGILIADVVLVPLEDGDRTEALVKLGKTVLTIDLNPLSRTAQKAHLTVVDNVVRALPAMVEAARELRAWDRSRLRHVWESWNNHVNLAQSLRFMSNRLGQLADEQEKRDDRAR